MAWNPSPKVAVARDVARTLKKDQIIIIGVDLNAGTLECITYGETKGLCDEAKELGDEAYDAVMLELGSRIT